MFGPHIMVDAMGVPEELASDLELVYSFMDKLPELMGMTKIMPPYCFRYAGLVPDDLGVSCVVLIAESHLTFHSFQKKGAIFFDAFSCKPFDTDLVLAEIQRVFKPTKMEHWLEKRGLDFPRGQLS